jgi:hypothetical protein
MQKHVVKCKFFANGCVIPSYFTKIEQQLRSRSAKTHSQTEACVQMPVANACGN